MNTSLQDFDYVDHPNLPPTLSDPLSASVSVSAMTIGRDALHVCAVVLSDGILFAAGGFGSN
jgi:hypothetical protein